MSFKNFLEERKYQIAYMEAKAFLEDQLRYINNRMRENLDNGKSIDFLYRDKDTVERLLGRLEKIEKENELELPSINEEDLDV